ncbi:AcrR family transcriptional regulator [Tsukamurella ocularis]|uniref:TetR/AcrR family transcriptional regulator n=1 Tax=Tsukamurella ocularis TaxID=1970234 RepID=UPI00216849F4|nr:TetR/AcrR family transcriptional regulator [Tsukamurella ocularis]MCS3787749.1 AcrR family transcriptional regulator [Tsukamurella ocularis]
MTRESTRPRSGTRGVPREVRAAEILEAAAAEFGTHGYAGAQVTAVAERAGVSKALVLAYFGSKEKLYIACVQKAGPLVFDAVRDAFAQPDPDALPGSLFNRAAVRVLTGIVTSLEGRIGYWALLYDRSVPTGTAGSWHADSDTACASSPPPPSPAWCVPPASPIPEIRLPPSSSGSR